MTKEEAILLGKKIFSLPLKVSLRNVVDESWDVYSKTQQIQLKLKKLLINRALSTDEEFKLVGGNGWLDSNYDDTHPLDVNILNNVNHIFDVMDYEYSATNWGNFDMAEECEISIFTPYIYLEKALLITGISLSKMEENDVLEFFDMDEDILLENISFEELEDLKYETICLLEKLKKIEYSDAKKYVSCIELLKEYIGDNCLCKFPLNDKDILDNIETLMGFFQKEYDNRAEIYFSKEVSAPGCRDLVIMNEDYFFILVNFGGYSEEGFLVDKEHLHSWWYLALNIVDTLLPMFINNTTD